MKGEEALRSPDGLSLTPFSNVPFLTLFYAMLHAQMKKVIQCTWIPFDDGNAQWDVYLVMYG